MKKQVCNSIFKVESPFTTYFGKSPNMDPPPKTKKLQPLWEGTHD